MVGKSPWDLRSQENLHSKMYDFKVKRLLLRFIYLVLVCSMFVLLDVH